MKKLNIRPKTKNNKVFPIVAIGASAGGLEAVTELLKHLANDSGMAYVYIQHLDPTHKSMLPEILTRTTAMKVQNAKNLLRVQPDNVYIIPSDKSMTIVDGVLKLDPRHARPAINMPIDKFFISLADKQKERAIGIVLSGNAHDGTAGLKAIKMSGGITFAQDESAKFESMPKSAIAGGNVDMILSPKEIAAELNRIGKSINMHHHILPGQTTGKNGDSDVRAILDLLRKSSGVNFQNYKISTIKRRILRRMVLRQLDTLKDYATYLKDHPEEISLLYKDVLINVTSFFRDTETLEYLKKEIFPEILKNKLSKEPLRIWVPACSTGEEAYSYAIILTELLHDMALKIPVQVFATDISEQAIAKARIGVFSRGDVDNVSPKRLQRFFTKVDGSYRINKDIRELCIFAPHNVFSDPPFSRLDLVSCCNLMIYLDAVLQKRLIAVFHYALANDGYLVLGKSETIGASRDLFSQVEKTYKVYIRRHDGSNKARIDLSHRLYESERQAASISGARQDKALAYQSHFEKTVAEILLTKYVPASAVVNKDLDILQLHGQVGFFLEISAGKPTLNLLKMARPGLAFELKNTVHKSVKSKAVEKTSGIEINDNGKTFSISIEVVPVNGQSAEMLFLIIFEKLQVMPAKQTQSGSSKDRMVQRLQQELTAVKEDMRSLLEEQDASSEELQSANEEIVSSNEELQSINEELETSKEEVESTNEELMTINSELQVRNAQLSDSYEYVEALFSTVRGPMLVLDKDLRVQSANKALYNTFKVNEEETEGILLFDLGDGQWNIPALRRLLEEILRDNTAFEGFEVSFDFPDIGRRTMLLNARRVAQKAHRKQLLLLAIEDITQQKFAQKVIADSESWFRNMTNNAPVMIWLTDAKGERTFFNKTWLEYTGLTAERARDEGWKEIIHPNLLSKYTDDFDKCFAKRKDFKFELRIRRNDGEYRWVLEVAKPYFSAEEQFLGFIATQSEIHDKKMMLDQLELAVKERTKDLHELNNELQRSNSELQQFAFVASHDLQEPLRKIMTFIDRIRDRSEEQLTETGKEFFDKIVQSSGRMAKLIDDLLDFSRISFAEKKYVATDLNIVLKDVIEDLDTLISDKKAKIESDSNLPTIQAVPMEMKQLFHNLITNSIKFAKADVPMVLQISCRLLSGRDVKERSTLDDQQSYAEIIFRDNGIGFNPQFAEQIFIIFQRLNDKKQFPGTGIGLALCRKIVTNHKGDIYATSTAAGAVFHVILPVNPALQKLEPTSR